MAELLITAAELQKSGPSEPAGGIGYYLYVLQHPCMFVLSFKLGASRRGLSMAAKKISSKFSSFYGCLRTVIKLCSFFFLQL